MYHFEHLLNQSLAVVFIDEVDGKDRWRIRTGTVVSGKNGFDFLMPPHKRPAFQLMPEWEDRIRVVPEKMLDDFGASFAIYVRVEALPKDADPNDFSPTGINLNS